ncbi:hypothetical protein ACFL56_01105 [Candidatus Margulisiibacteriota bacterium]
MFIRRLIIILILILLGISIGMMTTYHNTTKKVIKKTVCTYMNAWIEGNTQKMYELLVPEEQEIASKEEYKKQFEELPIAPMNYALKKVKIKGHIAYAILKIQWPGNLDNKEDSKLKKESIKEYIFLRKVKKEWRIVENESSFSQ